jgi:hypothetical protein
MSNNWEAIEREADNYAKITKAGFVRGQFVELLDFLPTASVITKKFRNQSALVTERGVADLKCYIALNGPLTGKELETLLPLLPNVYKPCMDRVWSGPI